MPGFIDAHQFNHIKTTKASFLPPTTCSPRLSAASPSLFYGEIRYSSADSYMVDLLEGLFG
jgi:hypothetical protein